MGLLDLTSMLMNEHCILNEVSLNRNTGTTRLYVDWLMKILNQRLTGISPHVFLGATSCAFHDLGTKASDSELSPSLTWPTLTLKALLSDGWHATESLRTGRHGACSSIILIMDYFFLEAGFSCCLLVRGIISSLLLLQQSSRTSSLKQTHTIIW